MGGGALVEEAEEEMGAAPPQLPLFSLSKQSPADYYGRWLVTPPHHAASIPFRWEEEPGKPRLSCCSSRHDASQLQLALSCHCCDGDDDGGQFKSLELPPRLLYNNNKSKTPSPTTVLKGSYVIGRSIFHSFRISRDRQRIRNGSASFDSTVTTGKELAVVVSRKTDSAGSGSRRRRFLGLWKKKRNDDDKKRNDEELLGSDNNLQLQDDGFVFPSVSGDHYYSENWGDTTTRKTTTTKTTSSLGLTKPAGSHFWANIYGAVKQVVIPTPRRTKTTTR